MHKQYIPGRVFLLRSLGTRLMHPNVLVGCLYMYVYMCVHYAGLIHACQRSMRYICWAQSVDPCFALAIHRMTHDCAIPGLRMHDEREGPLLATLPAR